MSDCCTSQHTNKSRLEKRNCPMCEETGLNVPVKTILHHIKHPWMYQLLEQQYYYCRNPNCNAVYFSTEGGIVYQSELRTSIGIKESADDALICFCFGVTKAEASTNKKAKEFVMQQTKASMCSCDTANPSGRCCLKDFPKFN